MITSKTYLLSQESRDEAGNVSKNVKEVLIWNATVANLSLMALGSSAPEILLSVLEICGNEFFTGDLGPSTIVGSAAFNLFVISAVCVYAIPNGEIRKIEGWRVYSLTAGASILAYALLYFMLVLHTPDVVDIWEAVLSFACFPLLVILAYAIDVGKLFPDRNKTEETLVTSQCMSYAVRRQMVIKQMLGRKAKNNHLPSVGVPAPSGVGFATTLYTVTEAAGQVSLTAERYGDIASPLAVNYSTEEGSAKAGRNFVATTGLLEFAPNESRKTFDVAILQDASQDDCDFGVKLTDPKYRACVVYFDFAVFSKVV
jgi:Ca2+/Na+ antiporter